MLLLTNQLGGFREDPPQCFQGAEHIQAHSSYFCPLPTSHRTTHTCLRTPHIINPAISDLTPYRRIGTPTISVLPSDFWRQSKTPEATSKLKGNYLIAYSKDTWRGVVSRPWTPGTFVSKRPITPTYTNIAPSSLATSGASPKNPKQPPNLKRAFYIVYSRDTWRRITSVDSRHLCIQTTNTI